MPRWTPFEVFGTGAGVKEGEPDPHWQLVARSDDPAFEPRPAVVTTISGEFSDKFRPNDDNSQWISAGGDMPLMTEHVTYTFRTTFILAEVPKEKTIVLRGGFMADNHVTAIRLNGRAVAAPEHGYQAPFNHYFQFSVNAGFVAGGNVLEIDVLNEAPGLRSSPSSPMALRVKLNGLILRGGRDSAPSNTPKTKGGKEVAD